MQARAMEWRQHPDWPLYEISECGDVRRGTKRLRGFIDGDGYLKYSLAHADGSKKPVHAHRLVVEAFIGPAPSDLHEIAHNNGSRVSNHFSNLRWATRKENDSDTVVHGTNRAGSKNGRAKIDELDVIEIRTFYRQIKDREVPFKVSALAKAYGLHHATLVSIATGRSWSHIPMDGTGS
jgi:hypothetical protein